MMLFVFIVNNLHRNILKQIAELEDTVLLNEFAVRFRYPDHMEIDDINIAQKKQYC